MGQKNLQIELAGGIQTFDLLYNKSVVLVWSLREEGEEPFDLHKVVFLLDPEAEYINVFQRKISEPSKPE